MSSAKVRIPHLFPLYLSELNFLLQRKKLIAAKIKDAKYM